MKNFVFGTTLALTIVFFLEIGQVITENPNSLFNINYFVKGAFLGILLAAVSTLFFREAVYAKNRLMIGLMVVIFLCAVASTILSFKFLLVGFVLHAIMSALYLKLTIQSYTVFDVTIVLYLIYLEYINVGDQTFFI